MNLNSAKGPLCTLALVLATGPTLADHNSPWAKGWAKMPNDMHDLRIDSLGDHEMFTDIVRAQGKRPNPHTAASTPLTDAEAVTLAFMREEEKMARDVYLTLYDLWQASIFENIAASEQRHFDAIGRLLKTYGIPDPSLEDIGLFTNSDLQLAYDDLVDRGSGSLLDALGAGALIEEIDIVDLQAAIDATEHADLARVYSNLLRGSRNHLRAFVSRIEALGVVYSAQYLTQEEVDAIVNSPMERSSR